MESLKSEIIQMIENTNDVKILKYLHKFINDFINKYS